MNNLCLLGRLSTEKKALNAEKIDSLINNTILTNCWNSIRGNRKRTPRLKLEKRLEKVYR